MAVVTVTGPPGCRVDEAARAIASRLEYEFVSEGALREMIAAAYGSETSVPARAMPAALGDLLAHLAGRHHLVVQWDGVETLMSDFPGSLRVGVCGGTRFRDGALMLDHRLDRNAARRLRGQLDHEQHAQRRRHFLRAESKPPDFDLVCNAEAMDCAEIADVVERVVTVRGLTALGTLPSATQAEIEFRARLALSRHGIAPAGRPSLGRKPFANRSEQVFANLLDFYRIPWEYEPRTFVLRKDEKGQPAESFTPDFYLPEFDQFIELTTMKQSLVTKKNRKVRLLRERYPRINIRIFYQKDFHDLVFKHGFASPAAMA